MSGAIAERPIAMLADGTLVRTETSSGGNEPAEPEEPTRDVHVVMIAHGLNAVTRAAVRGLLRNAQYRIARVTVVDNGSPKQDEASYAKLFRDGPWTNPKDMGIERAVTEGMLELRRSDTNQEFAAACNSAAASWTGSPYVLFLNNDVIVTEDFVSKMADLLDRRTEAAVVGAMMLGPGTCHVQHAGVAFNDDGNPEHAFYQWDMDSSQLLIEQKWPAVTGGCLMVRRADFDSVGGFRVSNAAKNIFEDGFPFEDVSLCLELLRRGRETWMCPTAKLFHYGSATVNAIIQRQRPEDQVAFIAGRRLQQLPQRREEWKDVVRGEDGKVHPWMRKETFEKAAAKGYMDQTVLIAVPVSGEYYWCLDMFLAALDALEYPRERLDIVFLMNNCSSDMRDKIMGWGAYKAQTQKRFRSVYVSSVLSGEQGHAIIVRCRNEAKKRALQGKYDALVFFDVDVIPPPDSVRRLVRALYEGANVSGGVYCYKGPDGKPLLFRKKFGASYEAYLAKMYTDQAPNQEMTGLDVDDDEHALGLVACFRLAWEALTEPGETVPIDALPFGLTALDRKAMEIPLVAGQKTSGTEDLSWFVTCAVRGLKSVAIPGLVAPHTTLGASFMPKQPTGEDLEAINEELAREREKARLATAGR